MKGLFVETLSVNRGVFIYLFLVLSAVPAPMMKKTMKLFKNQRLVKDDFIFKLGGLGW